MRRGTKARPVSLRAIGISNVVGAVLAGIAAYFEHPYIFPRQAGVTWAIVTFLSTLLDFPAYMLAYRAVAVLFGARTGEASGFLAQISAFTRYQIPLVLDAFLLFAIFIPRLGFGINVIGSLIAALAAFYVLPVPALMASYGFSRRRAIAATLVSIIPCGVITSFLPIFIAASPFFPS